MRTALVLGAAVASFAIAAGPAQAKSQHTVRFKVTIPTASILTNPPGLFASPTPPPPGAYTIAGSGTANGPGRLDGKISFSLTAFSENEQLLTAVLRLPTGTMVVTGVATDAPDVEHFALTGGTGRYAGVRGEATLTDEKNSDVAETFTLTFKYKS